MRQSRPFDRARGLWLTAAAAALLSSCSPTTGQPPADSRPPISLGELLAGGDTEGFARALAPRDFAFPDDHGSHPAYRSEWWYLTGNLTTSGGRRFGYQFTLFRNAVATEAPERSSEWATNQIYMAHFALTDVAGPGFHAFERFSRAAVGLAGVEVDPFRAWLDDWELRGANPPPFLLAVATAEGIGVELELDTAKPVVLQGDRGLSRKGREPGNASYYYSFTRMPTRGVVSVGLKSFEVQGASWMDREWSTSALEEGQVGWDWLSLQLSDGTDLMLYQLRRVDGSADERSSGTLVGVDGSSEQLRATDFSLESLEWWTSPATGVRYPSTWRLMVPQDDLELVVTPLIPNQELALSVRYWEGAVSARGTTGRGPVSGHGYVELTGYE